MSTWNECNELDRAIRTIGKLTERQLERGADPIIPPTVQPGYHIPTEQEVKDGTVNMELMKACFVELPKNKQVELYEWIYRTFDHCRIYA